MWNGQSCCKLLKVYLCHPTNDIVIFFEIFIHRVLYRPVKSLDNGALHIGIVSHMKISSLSFQVLSVASNSVPLSHCVVISFLHAYRENMSMMFKSYLYLSLYLVREIKSGRYISQTSSIFVTVYGMRGNLFVTSLCRVYVL